jgi:hypothetical protein
MKRKRFPAACARFPAITESVRAAQRMRVEEQAGRGEASECRAVVLGTELP